MIYRHPLWQHSYIISTLAHPERGLEFDGSINTIDSLDIESPISADIEQFLGRVIEQLVVRCELPHHKILYKEKDDFYAPTMVYELARLVPRNALDDALGVKDSYDK